MSIINDIKQDMHRQTVAMENIELIVQESVSTSVRDAMLDDREHDTAGAEDDPLIKKLVDKIPAYEDEDLNFKKKIEQTFDDFVNGLVEHKH